ncbi:MAG: sulfotransferase [Deltaproteobacteria bacterium]|nr:sulfotransferase [Deltaproteobacteria bacterium]
MPIRPLIISGTPRGGTNLLDMILSVHPEVTVAQNPYLPLLKSFRNTLIRRSGKAPCHDWEAPLDEYYYFDHKLEVMRLIQAATMDIPFDASEVAALMDSQVKRMSFSSPRLIPLIDHLKGETYRQLLDSGLRMIRLAHQRPEAAWVGFNDNWAIEFFAPIARSFPEARFMVILRDVRACISSHLRLMQAVHTNPLYQYPKDRSLVALILSFARCWRKQVAFARHYQGMDLFKGRLHILTYEQLVKDPEKATRRLCDFLEIDYRSGMIDTKNFVAPDGGAWLPNSNQEGVPQQGIFQDTVDRWKRSLDRDILRLIEFVTAPDLAMAGYTLAEGLQNNGFYEEAYRCHVRDSRECQGWRTDNRNAEVDFGLELLRQSCLDHRTDEAKLIERCFLFPEVYRALLDKSPLL